jgi:hypothetical protein
MLEAASDAGGARPDAAELGLAESLCLAARVKGALATALTDSGAGGGIFEAIDSLPADEAARVAELRREFERVLAALSQRPGPAADPGARPS